jgi:hypothetical protein
MYVYTLEELHPLEGPLVEAGSNTSTVILLVVRGDKKGTQFLGA